MIDRIEAEVGSLVLYRGAFINLQFPVRGGGERNTNGFADAKNAAWIPLGRFASTESLVSIRHDKRRAYLFDRANASSLETREGLPFATGTFAIFRDVIVAQHEFYFSLRVTHTESASKVYGSRRPRSFQVILFKSLLRLKLFELKNINRNIKFLAIYFTLPKTF